MKERLRGELGKILDQYDEAKRATQAREQKVRDEDAAFLRQFTELRRKVIRPVFEAAGEVLAARGHGFAISEHESAVDAGGRASEASIAFHVTPAGQAAGADPNDPLRSLSFTTRHYNKTIWVSGGAAAVPGGMASEKGAFKLAQIDAGFVEDEVLRFVAGLVKA